MKPDEVIHRRRVLQWGGAAAAASSLVPGVTTGRSACAAPSERINVAILGMGGRGGYHRGKLVQMSAVQVRAVCDPNAKKARAARDKVNNAYAEQSGQDSYEDCRAYQDFRKVLDRDDIDAVFIASPENWHALLAASAARAGKDVYCEKALTLTVQEGRRLANTVRSHGTVLQVGTQQRSASQFRRACELVRNGYLGTMKDVRIGVPGGRGLPLVPAKQPPPHLDYDLWLGPAPWTPYDEQKCTRLWYFMTDYCAGWIQSWGVHHLDILQWAMPDFTRGQVSVEGAATFPDEGPGDTSIHWDVAYTSSEGRVAHFGDNATEGYSQGVRFIGEDGWLHVSRGGLRAEPQSLLDVDLGPGEEHLHRSHNHGANFLECIRTRQDPAAPVEAGHRATSLSLIADIATRLGRKLTFDWDSETFVDAPRADNMLSRTYRGSWRL